MRAGETERGSGSREARPSLSPALLPVVRARNSPSRRPTWTSMMSSTAASMSAHVKLGASGRWAPGGGGPKPRVATALIFFFVCPLHPRGRVHAHTCAQSTGRAGGRPLLAQQGEDARAMAGWCGDRARTGSPNSRCDRAPCSTAFTKKESAPASAHAMSPARAVPEPRKSGAELGRVAVLADSKNL